MSKVQYIDAASNFRENGVHGKVSNFVLKRACFIAQETVYWRREVWEQVGPLDETFQYAMDYEYWQSMMAAGHRFELLPYFLGCFRLHPASKGVVAKDIRERELRAIYERYLGRVDAEEQIRAEIGIGWFRRRALLRRMSRLGILDRPLLARIVTGILSSHLSSGVEGN